MATILIADDSIVCRRRLTLLLTANGHRCLEASDGQEALDLVRAKRPDLALLDVLMPIMDGYQFVQKLRSDPEISHIPVIFCTSVYNDDEAHSLAEKCGVHHILVKDSSTDEILRIVNAILDRSVGPAATLSDEEFVQRHYKLLFNQMSAKVVQLQAVNRELEAKNEENEMFVYSVSHDLRSPLVNLEGFSSELAIICDELRTLFTEAASLSGADWEREGPRICESGLSYLNNDAAEAVNFIQSGVKRLSTIIDALLQLSRAGRVQYQSHRVDAAAIVARIVASLDGTITKGGAEVNVGHLPPVWGDPTAIEQLFANLIENALKYLDPKKPGVVEVGCDADKSVESKGEFLQTYFVKDNGLGIPKSHQAKVFQIFQRLHPESAQGEGVGLALVRRIVERLGGRIWVESTENTGSTFYVSLPKPSANGEVVDSQQLGTLLTEKELAKC